MTNFDPKTFFTTECPLLPVGPDGNYILPPQSSADACRNIAKELDPSGATYICLIRGHSNGGISVFGQWSPGKAHPFFGPTGSPTEKLNGVNKWAAIVSICSVDPTTLLPGKVIKQVQYPGQPVGFDTNAYPNGVWVAVHMNDEPGQFGNNRQHPTDPMRASVSGCA